MSKPIRVPSLVDQKKTLEVARKRGDGSASHLLRELFPNHNLMKIYLCECVNSKLFDNVEMYNPKEVQNLWYNGTSRFIKPWTSRKETVAAVVIHPKYRCSVASATS